jgi:hypothetical protein
MRFSLFLVRMINKMIMTRNVGSVDKTIRVVVGLLIAVLGIYFQSWWGLVAIVPLATALLNFCPLYTLVGCNTCAGKKP